MSGSTNESGAVHPARVDALSRKLDALQEDLETERERREQLEERLAEVEDMLEGVGVESVDPTTPDKRALAIRQWLWKEANSSESGKAAMDKDRAAGLLGDIARTQRYEAMRRAADGSDGAKQGSSSLSNQPGFEFQRFDHDDERNTRVILDLEEAQRKNWTLVDMEEVADA